MDHVTNTKAPRRNRMRRTSTGRRIELSARDISIFQLLGRYRYLRSTFIHAFVGGDKTQLLKRLGNLFHESYLDRPRQQWEAVNARYQPAVYEIGERALEALRAGGLIDPAAVVGIARSRTGAQRQFAHSLMICDILASIELATKHSPKLRFIPWQEIIAKAPESTRSSMNPFQIPVSISYTFPGTKKTRQLDTKLIPDGLFGLQYIIDGSKSYRFFAIEADRNTMPISRSDLDQTSYLRKILAYRQIVAHNIHKTHFGVPNLLVLNVTTNDVHMGGILRLVEKVCCSSTLFLFKSVSSFAAFDRTPLPDPHILTEPWRRAGLEPFLIDGYPQHAPSASRSNEHPTAHP
jgi:Replication-relaxation